MPKIVWYWITGIWLGFLVAFGLYALYDGNIFRARNLPAIENIRERGRILAPLWK